MHIGAEKIDADYWSLDKARAKNTIEKGTNFGEATLFEVKDPGFCFDKRRWVVAKLKDDGSEIVCHCKSAQEFVVVQSNHNCELRT